MSANYSIEKVSRTILIEIKPILEFIDIKLLKLIKLWIYIIDSFLV